MGSELVCGYTDWAFGKTTQEKDDREQERINRGAKERRQKRNKWER